MSKLYTEEQVKEAFEMGHAHGTNWIHPNLYHSMKKLTPIELPIDEEIRERAENSGGDDSLSPADEYENGAKWMKEQILNQNK